MSLPAAYKGKPLAKNGKPFSCDHSNCCDDCFANWTATGPFTVIYPDTSVPVSFTDTSPDAVAWEWDFGDGGSSTFQNPMHTYTETGCYPVSLTITNSSGKQCSHDGDVCVEIFADCAICTIAQTIYVNLGSGMELGTLADGSCVNPCHALRGAHAVLGVGGCEWRIFKDSVLTCLNCDGGETAIKLSIVATLYEGFTSPVPLDPGEFLLEIIVTLSHGGPQDEDCKIIHGTVYRKIITSCNGTVNVPATTLPIVNNENCILPDSVDAMLG